ncbi:MAG: S8 family serine peptidase [Actinomycetia bacterium]|nr:S8 family serine peptidase [Actinomycetes bacterium]
MKSSSVITGALTVAIAATLPVLLPSAASDDLGPTATTAPTATARQAPGHRLVIKLASPGVTARATASAEAARVAGQEPQHLGGGWYLLTGVDDVPTARATLSASSGLRAVQVDHVRHAFGDPYYKRYQPYLRASMDVNQAWRRSSGYGVKVAIVDTGVDPRHEDLPKLLNGHDFVSADGNADDGNGHGTFVAGVIAAQRNNGRGIAGISRASIMPVRVLNSRGFGRDSDIARGIRWAADEGADIINMSLGGGRSGRLLKDAVRYATNHGSLVVAASGNSGGTQPMYPAAYPQVIAVGATDIHDQMTWFTDHGPWLDVVAPGDDIASTVPGNRYAVGAGTSFSSPLVAGSAALVLSEHRRWSVEQLRAAVLRGAADAGPVGPDPFTGLGVLDVDGMVGGSAKIAVSSTGPITGTAPSTARPLRNDSIVAASSPEGTDHWFQLDITAPTRVSVSAATRTAKRGVLRGDIELSLYDASFGRLDVANARSGSRTETVRAVVDDAVYVRVRNLKDTRWPSAVNLGIDTSTASAGNVQSGGAPRPALLGATPVPESYGAMRSAPIDLLLGAQVAPGSVDSRSVQLIDGETGLPLARTVNVAGNTLTVTPDAELSATRNYAAVLNGLRTTGGRTLADVRSGFRTAS